MPLHLNLHFDYAIRFPDGQYYNGDIAINQSGHSEAGRTNVPMHVYTYVEKVAHSRIANNPELFKNCTVERFIP